MPPSESPPARPRLDWRGWIALAWFAAFGVLYALKMLEARGPGLLAFARRLF